MNKPVETVHISQLLPDERNANKGTARGAAMIEDSLRKYGAGRSILIDKNGRVIAGNKTLENAGQIGLEDVIVVPTDGTKIVAVQRTDLDLEQDARAKELAVADNRAGQVSLDWDGEVLKELDEEINLKQFFTDEELAAIVLNDNPEFSPATIEEQGKLDEKKPVECPNCGHKFRPE